MPCPICCSFFSASHFCSLAHFFLSLQAGQLAFSTNRSSLPPQSICLSLSLPLSCCSNLPICTYSRTALVVAHGPYFSLLGLATQPSFFFLLNIDIPAHVFANKLKEKKGKQITKKTLECRYH